MRNVADVYRWLRENGGQKSVETDFKTVEDPNAEPGPYGSPKKTVKVVTWTAKNGKTLTMLDRGPKESDPTMSQEQARALGAPEGTVNQELEFLGEGDENKERADPRSPEKKKSDAAYDREATWNQIHGPNPDTSHPAYNPKDAGRGSGRYESHADREERERKEEDQRMQREERDRRTRTDEKANELKEKELEIRREQERRAAQAADRQATNEASRIAIDAERLDVERSRANRPTIIGTPTFEDKTIQQQNPDGTITTTENPIYDELRAKAKEKREELRAAIEHNQMTAQIAAQKYKEWYDKEVAVPLALAKERREQAAERRAAQQAADEERRFAAKYELDKSNLGQQAAESAQANERALLPYRVGPKFGGQFSSAVNGLSGKMDQNSEDGIKFTADAFEFKRPDFAGIARNATKDALKHLTPYQPTDVSQYATADYTGITMPTMTPTGAPAPESPSYIDTSKYLPPQS